MVGRPRDSVALQSANVELDDVGACTPRTTCARPHSTRIPDRSSMLSSGVRRPLIGFLRIDPSFVITHRVKLDKGPEMYKTFRDKQDGCIKVVLKP